MERLLERIAEGELPPGEWLPSEQRMMREFEISRGVARETVQALNERGVLGVKHGRGQWVRPEQDWNVLDPQVLAAVVAARRFDLVEEVVDCRALLGPSVAELAAGRATGESLALVDSTHARLRDATKLRRRPTSSDDPFVAAEIEFHRAIARTAGNRALSRLLDPVDTGLAVAHHELAADQRDAIVRQLDKLRAAVAARDAARARSAVERGVAQTRRWLKQAQSTRA
jgi:DNA-binding FadR family transcriptional regulator